MKQHNRSRSRKMDLKHANRKRKIAMRIMGGDLYDNLHQYSKNKIHCSCCMCNPRKSWGCGANSLSCNSIGDQKKIQSMRRRMEEDMDSDFENDAG